MSDQLMDTERGGEQTQYEGVDTFTKPHDKQAGQLGDPATATDAPSSMHKSASDAPNTQGITPSEKIRYGQSIQEGGMGGKTVGSSGQADAEVGTSAAQERRQQGYGGAKDMDRNVGA